MKNKKMMQKKDYNKMALALSKKLNGKIEVTSKVKLKTMNDWSTVYTPGVAAVSRLVAAHPDKARQYTMKGNTVAIISDGSAVLGLGNIGPFGALPVMEGKCIIFKEMAGINAFPIVLNTQNTEEIITIVKAIAPGFGGINLEDISAPRCFDIEKRLKSELTIPVFHDDQHGTAIVVLSGIINAAKVVHKKLSSLHIVIVGAGAAGTAVAMLLLKAGIKDIIVSDRNGIIVEGRKGLTPCKKALAKVTNKRKIRGAILSAVTGADVVIGVSGPGTISRTHIKQMAPRAIVFALANPISEINPEDAKSAGATIVATGRSDYPNQVNNSLVFPGIFRGALDHKVQEITDDMKLSAAKQIASLVKNPTTEMIIPSVMEKNLVKKVASAVKIEKK